MKQALKSNTRFLAIGVHRALFALQATAGPAQRQSCRGIRRLALFRDFLVGPFAAQSSLISAFVGDPAFALAGDSDRRRRVGWRTWQLAPL